MTYFFGMSLIVFLFASSIQGMSMRTFRQVVAGSTLAMAVFAVPVCGYFLWQAPSMFREMARIERQFEAQHAQLEAQSREMQAQGVQLLRAAQSYQASMDEIISTAVTQRYSLPTK